MIELPEALTIARQMSAELKGKRIESALRGNAPHKFAFYNRPPEEYETLLQGKTVGEAVGEGGWILTSIDPDHLLLLGGGGERILYHRDDTTLPKKHQFLLRFNDGTYLTVSIQMWGSIQLLTRSEVAQHRELQKRGVSPLSDAFTFEFFNGLFDAVPAGDPRSIKYFVISDPAIWGVANGCLQDILFRARIHPRRRVVTITPAERQALYDAIRSTVKQMVELGGRDSERDLYNQPGGYRRILGAEAAGRPCPACGTAIEKIQFLGGASYFCPACQV